MARPSNLEKMSYVELSKLEVEIARLKAEKQSEERAALSSSPTESGGTSRPARNEFSRRCPLSSTAAVGAAALSPRSRPQF